MFKLVLIVLGLALLVFLLVKFLKKKPKDSWDIAVEEEKKKEKEDKEKKEKEHKKE